MDYDVLIIGGGTSGMMAAVSAAENGASVGLIEKNKTVGRKLLVTGNGRCNVTNNRDKEEIIAHIPGNGRFLYGAFSQYDNYDIMNFFRSNGVTLKEEDHGRMFPTTDKSRTIVETLIQRMTELNVDLYTDAPVDKLLIEKQLIKGVLLKDGRQLTSTSVLISSGGKAMPRTGSTGDGYAWAKQAGHTIKPLYPTEVPLTSNESFIQNRTLQGLSLRDIALHVYNKKGKTVITHQMDMIFTHFGISGPAVLRCSMFALQTMKRDKTTAVTMAIDALPDFSKNELLQTIQKRIKQEGEKSIKNALKGLVPERYLLFFLDRLSIPENLPLKQILSQQIDELVSFLKDFQFDVHGSLPIEKAFVTGGGVSTKEINPKTMESKLTKGLFFSGEVIDYNGYTGGYNITGAFITGHIAGQHAAEHALTKKQVSN